MEDGSPTRSLLLKPKLDNYGESSNRGHDGVLQTESSSTITFVVVLSTLVAACGSYAFGNAVWYSSPAESGIEDDLGLGSAEYSVFGSLLTTGAMLGAVLSGKIADFIGRRGAMGASEMFCILGWLAIFSKVPVYIAEITPKSVRGAFTSLTQVIFKPNL